MGNVGITVLGVCGSPVKESNTGIFLAESLNQAAALGAQTELVNLRDYQFGECLHCNFCIRKQSEGVYCSQKDDLNRVILPKVEAADALLVASPVYFGRLSALTAMFLDRLRVFAFGNCCGGKMRNKVGGSLAVAWSRNAGLETTLLSINYAFLALEMILASVHHEGVIYGAAGLTSRHGSGKFDPAVRHGIREDEPGLKQARALARRTVELAGILRGKQPD